MTPHEREAVVIECGGVALPGLLGLPVEPSGIVVFAHGSGSTRHSPRSRRVADALQVAGFGVLLFDLLSLEEEQERENVFDVGSLAARLQAARQWVARHHDTAGLPVGYFGASTGAAAALVAAADDRTIQAIVSRGGRPDLAGSALGRVRAPTLLIVGGKDDAVRTVNEDARRALRCETALEIVPGATHLFAEPGALEAVTHLALAWFERHLAPNAAGAWRASTGVRRIGAVRSHGRFVRP